MNMARARWLQRFRCFPHSPFYCDAGDAGDVPYNVRKVSEEGMDSLRQCPETSPASPASPADHQPFPGRGSSLAVPHTGHSHLVCSQVRKHRYGGCAVTQAFTCNQKKGQA